MKVYVLESAIEYEGSTVEGVYATPASAMLAAARVTERWKPRGADWKQEEDGFRAPGVWVGFTEWDLEP